MDTLKTLYDKALGLEANQVDVLTSSDQIAFQGDGITIADHNGTVMMLGLEPLAVQQMADKLGIPNAYLQKCPEHLQHANLKYWAGVSKKGWLVRTDTKFLGRPDTGFLASSTARAVLDKDYHPILNSFILESLIEFTKDIPHTIHHAYLERDAFNLRLGFDDVEIKGGNYAVGVYFGNGGVGNQSFSIKPFIQRGVCTNTTQWKDGGYIMSHIRASLAFLKGTIKEKLGQVFQTSATMLEHLVEAEMRSIPDPAFEIARICKANHLNRSIENEILTGTENMRNGLGVVHGLSWAAHFAKSEDEKIRLEELSGAYLVDPSSVFARQVEVEL